MADSSLKISDRKPDTNITSANEPSKKSKQPNRLFKQREQILQLPKETETSETVTKAAEKLVMALPKALFRTLATKMVNFANEYLSSMLSILYDYKINPASKTDWRTTVTKHAYNCLGVP